MKILLIYDPESRHGAIWLRWLIEDGHTVIAIKDKTSVKNVEVGNFDLVVPLITVRDYANRPNPRMDAFLQLEINSTKLLMSSTSIAASSDKLLTFQAWRKNDIKQPFTLLYDGAQYIWSEHNDPVIVKPRFGHSGTNVILAKSLKELQTAVKQIKGDALIQEYIERPRCIRLIATDRQVLSAYEKVLDDHVVVSVEKGAIRKYFEPSKELIQFAMSAIEALGGGLIGLDVLEKDGQYIALEANVPFGFDENNDELKAKLLSVINDYQSKILLN